MDAKLYTDLPAASLALQSKRVDAVAAPSASNTSVSQNAKDRFETLELKDMLDLPAASAIYGIQAKKGTGLASVIVKGLQKMYESGTYAKLFGQWGLPLSTVTAPARPQRLQAIPDPVRSSMARTSRTQTSGDRERAAWEESAGCWTSGCGDAPCAFRCGTGSCWPPTCSPPRSGPGPARSSSSGPPTAAARCATPTAAATTSRCRCRRRPRRSSSARGTTWCGRTAGAAGTRTAPS
ncbi:hypothetical protein GCM10017744_017670 [Streptomyces antimycoticus]